MLLYILLALNWKAEGKVKEEVHFAVVEELVNHKTLIYTTQFFECVRVLSVLSKNKTINSRN